MLGQQPLSRPPFSFTMGLGEQVSFSADSACRFSKGLAEQRADLALIGHRVTLACFQAIQFRTLKWVVRERRRKDEMPREREGRQTLVSKGHFLLLLLLLATAPMITCTWAPIIPLE
ncbi:hypothetical protein Aperf_G00000070853 [Anoplocephala perfoliata]